MYVISPDEVHVLIAVLRSHGHFTSLLLWKQHVAIWSWGDITVMPNTVLSQCLGVTPNTDVTESDGPKKFLCTKSAADSVRTSKGGWRGHRGRKLDHAMRNGQRLMQGGRVLGL